MEFGVLGTLQVVGDGGDLSPRPGKRRVLLARLLCAANQAVPDEALTEALWGARPPATATKNLHLYVYHLRGALGDRDRIVRHADGYELRVKDGELDAGRFDRLIDHGLHELAAGAAFAGPASAALREALALWRGPIAYDGLHGVPLLRDEANRLEERRLRATEAAIGAELGLGRHLSLVAELTGLVAAYPLREGFRAQLMHALYRSGRRAEALEVYHDARRALVEELGIEPGPELRDLQHAVLIDDPRIRPAPARRGPITEPVAERSPATGGCWLPMDIPDFTGRAAQLAWLRRELTSGRGGSAGPIVAISGMGGVGKSALAVRAAYELADDFPDGRLYVDLGGSRDHPAEPAAVLARVLRALGVGGTALPENLDERAALYRSLLTAHRVLLVLDNATSEAQIRHLLPGGGTTSVLITGRTRLTGLPSVRLLDLDVLEPDAAIELLARQTGTARVRADPGTARELTRLCGRLPLALRIAGAKLKARQHWSLADLTRRLSDEHRRLGELSLGELSVRANLSLSYRRLDPLAQRLLRRASLLDVPDFAPWIAAALCDVTGEAAEDAAERLADSQLLRVVGRDPAGQVRFRFHDLVCVYARERAAAEETAEERDAAIARALGHALAMARQAADQLDSPYARAIYGAPTGKEPVVTPLSQPLSWLSAEAPALVAAVGQAAAESRAGLAWQLTSALQEFFDMCEHLDDRRYCIQVATEAVQAADDRPGQAAMLASQGVFHALRWNLAAADACYRIALDRFGALHDDHGRAVCLTGLSAVHRRTGRPDTARTYAEQALAITGELGDERGRANALRVLARALDACGEHDLARHRLTESLTGYERIGNVRGSATAFAQLGALDLDSGHPGRALPNLERAYRLLSEVGDDSSAGAVGRRLGEALLRLGRYPEARRELENCLDDFRRAGIPHLQIRTLRTFAELERLQGRAEQAAAHLREAEVLAVKYRDL